MTAMPTASSDAIEAIVRSRSTVRRVSTHTAADAATITAATMTHDFVALLAALVVSWPVEETMIPGTAIA